MYPVPRLFCENMEREVDSETDEKPTQPDSLKIEQTRRENYEGASTTQARRSVAAPSLSRIILESDAS